MKRKSLTILPRSGLVQFSRVPQYSKDLGPLVPCTEVGKVGFDFLCRIDKLAELRTVHWSVRQYISTIVPRVDCNVK